MHERCARIPDGASRTLIGNSGRMLRADGCDADAQPEHPKVSITEAEWQAIIESASTEQDLKQIASKLVEENASTEGLRKVWAKRRAEIKARAA